MGVLRTYGQDTSVTKPLRNSNGFSFAPTVCANQLSACGEICKAMSGKMPLNNGHELETRACVLDAHSRRRENFTIEYKLDEGSSGEIKICDLTGRTIKKQLLYVKSTSLIFKESELSPGLYYFTAWINNKLVSTQKFVIIK